MQLGDVLDDREPQPRTASITRARPIDAIEAFENACLSLKRDADAVVAHSNDR
jgi:hypothetical protein